MIFCCCCCYLLNKCILVLEEKEHLVFSCFSKEIHRLEQHYLFGIMYNTVWTVIGSTLKVLLQF